MSEFHCHADPCNRGSPNCNARLSSNLSSLGNLERGEERLKTLQPVATLKEGQPMSAADRFIAWCKQEQASLQQQLELLEASKVLTGEDRGSGWINTTTNRKNAPRRDSLS